MYILIRGDDKFYTIFMVASCEAIQRSTEWIIFFEIHEDFKWAAPYFILSETYFGILIKIGIFITRVFPIIIIAYLCLGRVTSLCCVRIAVTRTSTLRTYHI